MPISVNNRMGEWNGIDIVENIIFWSLVVYISWNEKATPEWMYIVLFAFVVYFGLRFIFKKKGMDRMVWLYSLNMIVILYLLWVFLKR
jgi:hypothetical protein